MNMHLGQVDNFIASSIAIHNPKTYNLIDLLIETQINAMASVQTKHTALDSNETINQRMSQSV